MNSIDDTYSRVLIYDKTLNKPIGFFHIKELLIIHDVYPRKKISKLKRDLLFFNEHLVVGDALREMLKKNIHIAAVNNKLGNAIGIVTQEDILEVFLGEIYDETDDETEDYNSSEPFMSSPEKHHLVKGGFLVSHLNIVFNLDLPYKNNETISMLLKKREKSSFPLNLL